MNKPIFTKISDWKTFNESSNGSRYELHFTDGIRQVLKGNDPEKLISDVTAKPEVREWSLFKTGPGFHSTTQDEFLVKWWDKYEDGYWPNMAKKKPELLDKQYKGINEDKDFLVIDATNVIFEEYTQTIRKVPENYWVASVKDGQLVFDSWDGMVKGASVDEDGIRAAWDAKTLPVKKPNATSTKYESNEGAQPTFLGPDELKAGEQYIMFTPDQVYPKMPVKYTGRRDAYYQFDLMPNSPSNAMNAEYNAEDMAEMKFMAHTSDNIGAAYKFAHDSNPAYNESFDGDAYKALNQEYDLVGSKLEDAIEDKNEEEIAKLKTQLAEIETKIHKMERPEDYKQTNENEVSPASGEESPSLGEPSNDEIAKPGFFSIDGETKYAGYTFGDDWNGFECPYFEKEAADKMSMDMMGRAEGDTYVFEQEDDEPLTINSEIIKTVDGDKKVWPIGAYYWVWSDATDWDSTGE